MLIPLCPNFLLPNVRFNANTPSTLTSWILSSSADYVLSLQSLLGVRNVTIPPSSRIKDFLIKFTQLENNNGGLLEIPPSINCYSPILRSPSTYVTKDPNTISVVTIGFASNLYIAYFALGGYCYSYTCRPFLVIIDEDELWVVHLRLSKDTVSYRCTRLFLILEIN